VILLTIVVGDIVDHNNITKQNGQQYHQPQWSTISPTTMVNNITNNGQQYHPLLLVILLTIVFGDIVNHCGW
jgi:hypothetical protein